MKPQSKPAAILKSVGFTALFFAAQTIPQYAAVFFFAFRRSFDVLASDENEVDLFRIAEGVSGDLYGVIYLVMCLSFVLFTFGVLLICLIRRRDFFERTSLLPARPAEIAAGTLAGAGTFLVAVLLINLLESFLPAYSQSAAAYAQQQALLQGPPALELFYVCVLGPIAEELLVRGLMLGTLKRSFSPFFSLLFSSALFGAIHGNLYQFVFTFLLGLILGYVALRCDSILPTIALHVVFNSCNYLFNLGDLLGYGSADFFTVFSYYAMLAIAFVSIPLSIFLFVYSFRKYHRGFSFFRRKKAAVPDETPAVPVEAAPEAPVETEEGSPDMAAPEFIIAGLGNPGANYASTRHNAGFMALDFLALRENVKIDRLRFSALTGDAVIGGRRVLLMKPQTFMNLSGNSVAEAARFYRIPAENILVIYDDAVFEPGEIRIRPSGSAGGHNGMKSVIASLGTEAFPRVRIGVGAPPEGFDLMRWVLAPLKGEDLDRVVSSLEPVYRASVEIVSGRIDHAMNEYNSAKK